jgi:hypothetical protein
MNKENKLYFLNKQLTSALAEVEDFILLFEFLETINEADIPSFYSGLLPVKTELLASATSKVSWLQQKIQEIEAE